MTRAPPRSEDARSHLSAGAPVLNCPGCGSKVAANTSICPVCDYIIDGSFLSDAPPADNDEESTDARAAPVPAPKPPARPRPAKSGARPAPSNPDATNIRDMNDVVRNAPPRASRPAAPSRGGSGPAPRRAAPQQVEDPGSDPWDRSLREEEAARNQPIADPDELIQDAKELLGAMNTGDKVAFYGAAAIIVSAFVPWKETAADGDVLGLMSTGVVAVVLALFVMSAIGVRVRQTFPNINQVVPWMAQLLGTFLCLIWCIVFIKVSSDTTLVPNDIGNEEIMNSSPSFGVFIALLGAVASLVGAFLGLRRND
ncbi:zinc ribbon domain-containing protein [Myxococcus sp. K15C18031901]|uniref:zinc ribbon domain-containing protein n=1 Tax=Myxococcus dinghuensis TaxID=2906761 RepID=UPI0020A7F546|nr:zinc ribbon domain-containing protein [Myxococcus dinghuensis]MCP3098593.1 zinc ribbon domain-containing protein [Myxococcus dinghuensis]